jgi:hypothetical protein
MSSWARKPITLAEVQVAAVMRLPLTLSSAAALQGQAATANAGSQGTAAMGQ